MITPAFPARWFYGLYGLSSVNQRLPPSPAQCVCIVANLAPAWARQDHTTSPSAPMPHVHRHQPVHRIPHHVRDDAYAPFVGGGMGELNHEFRKNERKIFLTRELDICKQHEADWVRVICPTGRGLVTFVPFKGGEARGQFAATFHTGKVMTRRTCRRAVPLGSVARTQIRLKTR